MPTDANVVVLLSSPASRPPPRDASSPAAEMVAGVSSLARRRRRLALALSGLMLGAWLAVFGLAWGVMAAAEWLRA